MGPAITRDAAGKGRERQDGAVGRGVLAAGLPDWKLLGMGF